MILFDNNFFANPHIKDILRSLAELKINNRSVIFESQSGYDGRLLDNDPDLAILLKKARFSNIRIAWDNGIEDHESIKRQISYLIKAGYSSKEIYVFMIYNFNIPYEIMIKKIEYCKKWKVQIADCRYRPLSTTFDNYKSYASKEGQTKKDYYIHEITGWSDKKIRMFRRLVRQHNMEIRYANGKKYNKDMEKWSAIHNTYKFFNLGTPPMFKDIKKNLYLQETIILLNRLKGYMLKNKIIPPNLIGLNSSNLNKRIIRLAKLYNLKIRVNNQNIKNSKLKC